MRKSSIFVVLALLVAGLCMIAAAEELRANACEDTDALSYGATVAVTPPIPQHSSPARRIVQRPLAIGAAVVVASRHVDNDVAVTRAAESRTRLAALGVLRC